MGSWQRLTASGVKREQIHVPSQTAIGEIKMARTVRKKALVADESVGRLPVSDFQNEWPSVSQSKCNC